MARRLRPKTANVAPRRSRVRCTLGWAKPHSLSKHATKAKQQKPNSALIGMHLRREALPKFYKNSPQKTTTSQPAKVHTTERLATQPRPSSPLLACGHTKQSTRLPAKPAAAPAAPQALPNANPRKPRLASNNHSHKKPRRPFSPPTEHPALPQPLGQAPQLPQRRRFSRRERPRATHRASPANQPPPDFQSPSLFQLPRRSTCLRRLSQPLSLPQNHLASPPLLLFAFSALPSSPTCPTIASAARRVFPEALLATLPCLQTAYVAPRRSRVR